MLFGASASEKGTADYLRVPIKENRLNPIDAR